MAKFTSVFLLISIVLLVTLLVFTYGESPPNGQQSRNRSRIKTLKKKKIATTVVPIEETTVALPDIEEISLDVEHGPVPENDEPEVDNEEEEVTTQAPVAKQKKQANPKSTAKPKFEGCDVCELDDCLPILESNCPTGLVLDRCSCCHICGAGEGNRCYNASLSLRYNPDFGICGSGLSCLLRIDLEPTEPPEALCECQNKQMVCGNNNNTYNSECKLREVAHSNKELALKHWGPCVSAPWISTAVENTTVGSGEDVSMSCEVRGYPPPIIHWKFLEENSNSSPIILPGDDSSVVVVVRGGPEQMMTTSWIQIISVTVKRQGTYFCVAKNDKGSTESFASVSVIPPVSHLYSDYVLR